MHKNSVVNGLAIFSAAALTIGLTLRFGMIADDPTGGTPNARTNIIDGAFVNLCGAITARPLENTKKALASFEKLSARQKCVYTAFNYYSLASENTTREAYLKNLLGDSLPKEPYDSYGRINNIALADSFKILKDNPYGIAKYKYGTAELSAFYLSYIGLENGVGSIEDMAKEAWKIAEKRAVNAYRSCYSDGIGCDAIEKYEIANSSLKP